MNIFSGVDNEGLQRGLWEPYLNFLKLLSNLLFGAQYGIKFLGEENSSIINGKMKVSYFSDIFAVRLPKRSLLTSIVKLYSAQLHYQKR